MTGPLIFAVEDEPLNSALLRAILVPAGYELHIEPDLRSGRAWLTDHEPALMLLDRHLPDGDGLDLVREIRATPAGETAVILLVSASVLPGDRVEAGLAGCDGFISKPIRVRELLDEIAGRLEAGATAGF